MRRIHLPVVDRRSVMRGIAAGLVAQLLGCGTDIGDLETAETPDAGETTTTPPPVDAPSPGFERCGAEICFDLAQPANAALRTVGGARIVTIDGKRLLVIRTTADAFAVLSAICTHAGCSVSYSTARDDVECPCHGSTFTLTGEVTHGPATSPLQSYVATFDAASETLSVAV